MQSDTQIADSASAADVGSEPIGTATTPSVGAARAVPVGQARAVPVEHSAGGSGHSCQPPRPSTDDLVEADLLVEDVSIDGMCGVY